MDIRSMNLEEMEALAISLGEKAFRGKQLFQWVHEKQADDFDEMTNLSAAFREKLKDNIYENLPKKEAGILSSILLSDRAYLLHIRCKTGGKTGVEKRRYGKVFICTGR